MIDTERKFTPQFWLLSLSSFLFFSSFSMLLPELPGYLDRMGGGEFKGLIVSLFTLSAGFSRPFSGKLTDTIGRVPVMLFGSFVCFVIGFLYPLATSVFPFLLVRLLHGLSTGFKPTATAAYIADILPKNNRGEGIGMHGMISSLGMAFGSAIGSWVVMYFGFNILFYTSSILSLLSLVILYNLKETLETTTPFSFQKLRLKKHEILDFNIWPVIVVMFFSSTAYGTIVTLIPDLTQNLGMKNKGYFFIVYIAASMLFRLLAGKWSDRIGRMEVAFIGSGLLLLCMFSLLFTHSIMLLTLTAILFGVSMGVLAPTLQAWTIDLSSEDNRGKALATMYIALEAGIGIGAFTSGLIYENNIHKMETVFLNALMLVSIPFLYLILLQRKNRFRHEID